MSEGDWPARGHFSSARKAGALLVDFILFAGVIYAGRVIAIGVALYVDNRLRQLIAGPAGATLDELQRQIRAHPLLLGRPALFELLCSDLGPAALLLLYLSFLKTELNGVTPGAMLLGGAAAEPRIGHALRGVFDELINLVSQTIQSWMPANVSPGSLRKRLSNLSELFAPARMLPAGARAVGLAALVMVAIATAATPIVYSLNNFLPKVGFENAYDKPAFIAQISVYLSLAVSALGWAAALVGASMTNLFALAVIGPIYLFSFAFLGLVSGRAWWLPIPQWTLALLAAMTPSSPRRWPLRFAVVWAFSALAVLHTFRLTPLHGMVTSSWRILAPLGLAAAIAISRLHPRPKAATRFIFVLAINGAFAAAALRAGTQPITAYVYESLYQLAGILTLFWFFLGTNLVDACIGLTGRIISTADRLGGERWLRWIVVGVCLVELFAIGELMRFNPAFMHQARQAGQSTIRLSTLPAHQGVAIAILLIAALSAAADGLTPARARGLLALWGFSLFLIWSFFLSAMPLLSVAGASSSQSGAPLHQGFALLQGIEKRLGGEKQFVAIGLVTFTLLWEVFAGARQEASDHGPWAQAAGALILYLGTLALLAALTHFAFVSATMSPQAADAYMYSGMQALWLPIALYAAFFAQRQVRTCERRIVIGAFFIGIVAATPVCFQRVLMGDPARLGLWANASVVAAAEVIILVDAIASVHSERMLRALDAAAAGVACALGLAVGYTQGLIAPLLGQFAAIVSTLTGLAPGLLRGWLDASRWNVVPQCDLLIFYLAVPASAGALAVLFWKARHSGKPASRLASAPVIVGATVACAAPLYANSALRLPFTPASASTLTPAAYFGSIAWLAPLVLACGLYIYAAAWRPAVSPQAQCDRSLETEARA